jgi:hypothetical protein
VVVVGSEDCASYRARVPKRQRLLAVAGLFNTGTNLLDTHLQHNVHLTLASVWQVPWGKHRMADTKHSHTAKGMEKIAKDQVLPVVIIRDPFAWLQSMCAHPYAAHWRYGPHHCPNLVPNAVDAQHFPHLSNHQSAFGVTVKFDKESHATFDSLAHLWSEWYAQYLQVDYPILMSTFDY